jgi:hypothetical protein
LLEELLAGGGKLSDPIFHFYKMIRYQGSTWDAREKQQNIKKLSRAKARVS